MQELVTDSIDIDLETVHFVHISTIQGFRKSRSTYSNTVEERLTTRCVSVHISSNVGLTRVIGRQQLECWMCWQVCSALQKISDSGDAFPGHSHVGAHAPGREQAQRRDRVGRGGSATPLLPVVQAIMVRIGIVS